MNKKILALLTAALLLFSMGLAAAEGQVKYHMVERFPSFDVEVTIPEGAAYKQNEHDDWLCLEMWYEDDSTLYFDLNITPSETVEDKSLQDFTQEELDLLEEAIGEDFFAPVHEYFVTPSGNTILFTRETDPLAGDYATMQTVYHGYFFYLYGCHKGYAPLSDADIAIMHQLVEGTDIIDTSK